MSMRVDKLEELEEDEDVGIDEEAEVDEELEKEIEDNAAKHFRKVCDPLIQKAIAADIPWLHVSSKRPLITRRNVLKPTIVQSEGGILCAQPSGSRSKEPSVHHRASAICPGGDHCRGIARGPSYIIPIFLDTAR